MKAVLMVGIVILVVVAMGGIIPIMGLAALTGSAVSFFLENVWIFIGIGALIVIAKR